MTNLRRDFKNREELIAYLKQEFPSATSISPHTSDFIGGRIVAEARLHQANTGVEYAKTRNFLDGTVTRLSPYIRYGVLSLAEVRDFAVSQTDDILEVEKFVNELGCRDYWQRIYIEIGDGIWQDLEDYKTGFTATDYADDLPEDIVLGKTGIRFIDDYIQELYTSGYLHNHARMWLAAYVVHWRRIKWQAGASWFLQHLLDGDPASNNLSWQWVASTFSSKPYYYNLENVLKYTGKTYVGDAKSFGHEAFVGTYEELATRLFPKIPPQDNNTPPPYKKGKRG
jgi:deoxyribodipyrimidine photo-lyase